MRKGSSSRLEAHGNGAGQAEGASDSFQLECGQHRLHSARCRSPSISPPRRFERESTVSLLQQASDDTGDGDTSQGGASAHGNRSWGSSASHLGTLSGWNSNLDDKFGAGIKGAPKRGWKSRVDFAAGDDSPLPFMEPGVLRDERRAIAYYHRPGDWREPPNLFNPFWGAKLMPVTDFRPSSEPDFTVKYFTDQLLVHCRSCMGRLKGTRQGRRRRPGTALTEFAIVAPLFIILIYWSQFFADLGVLKLKAEEAARYATWEMTAQRSPRPWQTKVRTRFAESRVSPLKPAAPGPKGR